MELDENDIILLKARKFSEEIFNKLFDDYCDYKTTGYYPIFIIGTAMYIKHFVDYYNEKSKKIKISEEEITSEISEAITHLLKLN